MPKEAWELEERVLLNKYRGKVSRKTAWNVGDFGPQLTMVVDVISVSDPSDVYFSEATSWYSVGRKDWTITDGGLKIQGAKADQKFHASSKYGRLVKAVTDLEVTALLEGGDPRDASTWWDHIFDWERVPIEIKGMEDPSGQVRDIETSVVVPVAYVGLEGQPAQVTSSNNVLSDDVIKRLCEVMSGKNDSAARVAIARDPVLSANDKFMDLLTSDFAAMAAQIQQTGALAKVADIWQAPKA